jgi:hypothetical protein
MGAWSGDRLFLIAPWLETFFRVLREQIFHAIGQKPIFQLKRPKAVSRAALPLEIARFALAS